MSVTKAHVISQLHSERLAVLLRPLRPLAQQEEVGPLSPLASVLQARTHDPSCGVNVGVQKYTSIEMHSTKLANMLIMYVVHTYMYLYGISQKLNSIYYILVWTSPWT